MHYGKYLTSPAVCFRGHPKNGPAMREITTIECLVTCPDCKTIMEKLLARVEMKVPEHLYSRLLQYCQNEGFSFDSDPCIFTFEFDKPEEMEKLREKLEVILKSGSDE